METIKNILIELENIIKIELEKCSKVYEEKLHEIDESYVTNEKILEEERKIIKQNAIDEFKDSVFILTNDDLKTIFKKLCKHIPSYNKGECESKFDWSACENCVLRNIEWNYGKFHRDLCFAIWHENILNLSSNTP